MSDLRLPHGGSELRPLCFEGTANRGEIAGSGRLHRRCTMSRETGGLVVPGGCSRLLLWMDRVQQPARLPRVLFFMVQNRRGGRRVYTSPIVAEGH